MSAEEGVKDGGAEETSKEGNEASNQQDKMKLEDMQEADEVYERIEELDNEIEQTENKLAGIDKQLADLRQGIGDHDKLMDTKNMREVVAGRLLILQHAMKQARLHLDSISNSTRSMLVKSLAALRTVLFQLFRSLQKTYNMNKSEKTKRLRDDTERRLTDTTNILAEEREKQSSTDEAMKADYLERVTWLVGGRAKNAFANLESPYFLIPRALTETARIERFMVQDRQQGTGAKIVLLLKHFALNDLGVQVVDLSYNSVGLWSNLLLTSLSENETLTDLKLRNCDIDDASIACLAEYFGKNHTLTSLDISKNLITSTGAAMLGSCLKNGTNSLTRIVIGDQDLTEKGSYHEGLSTLMSSLRNLNVISLANCSLYSDGARVFKRLMNNNNSLLNIDLSSNYLTNRGAAQLSECLLDAKQLKVLRLRECFIHDHGFNMLIDVIFGKWDKRGRQLHFLDLSGNRISDKGIAHLASVCDKSITKKTNADAPFAIHEVRLCNNALTFAGAKELGRSLAQCSDRTSKSVPSFSLNGKRSPGQPFIKFLALESLLDLSQMDGKIDVCHTLEEECVVLEGMGIGSLGATAVAQMLRQNVVCSSVSMRGNHLDTEAAAHFAAGLSQSGGMEYLKYLDLSYNLIRLDNLKHAGKFFRALAKLKKLRSLRMDSNEQKDDALWGWASYLAVNPPLRALSIRDQDFTRRKALSNLLQNLRFNNNLVLLDIRYNPRVINEYVFSAESLNEVAREIEVTNPGLSCMPFHEDPSEVIRAPRRRLPGRPDLYPTLKLFTHDMMHRQRQARVNRFEVLMKRKGRLHIREKGSDFIVV